MSLENKLVAFNVRRSIKTISIGKFSWWHSNRVMQHDFPKFSHCELLSRCIFCVLANPFGCIHLSLSLVLVVYLSTTVGDFRWEFASLSLSLGGEGGIELTRLDDDVDSRIVCTIRLGDSWRLGQRERWELNGVEENEWRRKKILTTKYHFGNISN